MPDNDLIRLAHVSSPMSWRGGEQQLFYLYRQLQNSNYKQVVFCPKGSELSLKITPSDRHTYKKISGFDIVAAWKLAQLCKKESIQIIHAHDAHAHTTAILAADIFGNKPLIVLSRRVDFPIGKSRFSKYKYNHRKIQRILCVSDAIKAIVSKSISAPHIQLKTIHSGVDTSKYLNAGRGVLRREFNIPPDAFLVGNVAALADHKDYPTFLHTVKLLASEANYWFIVVGSGPLESELKDLAEKLNIGDRLIFTGFRADLGNVFADLDVLLFTSKTEGLGTTILDAFACDVPVVATAAGGIPEMIEHQKTGLLHTIGDSKALAAAIQLIANNSALRLELVERAHQKLQNFTAEAMAAKTMAEYRSLLDY